MGPWVSERRYHLCSVSSLGRGILVLDKARLTLHLTAVRDAHIGTPSQTTPMALPWVAPSHRQGGREAQVVSRSSASIAPAAMPRVATYDRSPSRW